MPYDCPDDDVLAQFVGRTLGEHERVSIEEHCEGCENCRALVTHLVEAFAESIAGPWEPAQELPKPGTTLGRYVILEWVGAGAMGAVFSAYDPELDRRVALKMLPPREGEGAERLRSRFLDEARAMASISHPNVIAVHDVGTHDGLAFFAMELVDGGTLDEWLAAEKRSTDAILSVFAAAGRGLAAAHEVGLVHRDFKPHNVLVGNDGRVRVIDFGLVRFGAVSVDSEVSISDADLPVDRTRTGALVGTPAYMAPEQLTAAAIDASTDQFAFCVSLYQALFGERPFAGRDVAALVDAIEAGPRFPTEGRYVSRRLRSVLQRGLSAPATERFPSMSDLLDVLSARSMAWWGLLGASAVLLVGSGFAIQSLATTDELPRCLPNLEELDGVWDATRRESLVDAVGGAADPGSAHASSASWLAGRFDRYAAQWRTVHHEVCVATVERGEQSVDVMDAKMACLRQARQQLGAHVTQVIGDAEAVASRVSAMVGTLPDLRACEDATALAAGPPAPQSDQLEMVEQHRRKAAEVKARVAAGDYEGGVALARELDDVAGDGGYGPLRYEAALLLGRSAAHLEGDETSAADLGRALHGALRAGDWPVALQAATAMACYTAGGLGKPDAALAYGRIALGLAERPGAQTGWVAQAHKCAGRALRAGGTYADAEAEYRAAVEVLQKGGEFDQVALTGARASLGVVLVQQGKVDEGLRELRLATDFFERELGPKHPESVRARTTLVSALTDAGRFESADAEYQRLIELVSRGPNPVSNTLATLHANRGHVFYGRGLYEEAAVQYKTAKGMLSHLDGPNHPRTLGLEVNLANVLLVQARFDEARLAYHAVREKLAHALPPDHPVLAQVTISLSAVELELDPDLNNAPDAKRGLLEIVRRCEAQSDAPPNVCGSALFILARTLVYEGNGDAAEIAIADSRRWNARSGRVKAELDEEFAGLEAELDKLRSSSDAGSQ